MSDDAHDYSGVRSDGRRLAAAGWTTFALGLAAAFAAAAIVVGLALLVLAYAWSLRGM